MKINKQNKQKNKKIKKKTKEINSQFIGKLSYLTIQKLKIKIFKN